MINQLGWVYRRIHFYLGNVYRLLTSFGYQKKINITEAKTIFGASFSTNGWHHICCTLKEYDINPNIDYQDTSMYAFLKYFNPESISDLADIHARPNLNLFVYPWGTFRHGEYVSKKNKYLSRFCGPSSDQFVKDEFERTISLYENIKKTGYKPWRYGNTFIGGTFLINQHGFRRFIVLQGNHRMAIFAHLGIKNIQVRGIKGYLSEIKENEMSQWLLVKSGLCSLDAAKKIFDMFFSENGYHLYRTLRSKE
jgi:hypothetical protein